jgi:hypothetical protein
MTQGDDRPASPAAASTRTLELAVALLAFAFGAVVCADSWRIGARWSDDGPQAGYFPFYIGLVVCISSAATFAGAWRRRALARESFVTRRELAQVLSLLLPLTIYIALIAALGIYVASCGFIAWFMARHGAHRAWVTAAVAIGVPCVLFLTFERWFKLPLPKGPLEALLGLG